MLYHLQSAQNNSAPLIAAPFHPHATSLIVKYTVPITPHQLTLMPELPAQRTPSQQSEARRSQSVSSLLDRNDVRVGNPADTPVRVS